MIVKRQGFDCLTEHDIMSKIGEKLPFYKQLYGGVYFVNEMPMNSSGKILRRVIREIAIGKYNERHKVNTKADEDKDSQNQ